MSCGRPLSCKRSSMEWGVASIKNVEPNGKENRGKEPRHAKRRKKRRSEGMDITPWPCCLERWPVATHHNDYQKHAHQEQWTQAPVRFPRRTNLKTGFPSPFLRSFKMRTCDLTSTARTMIVPVSFLPGKFFELCCENFDQKRKSISDFLVFKYLGLANSDNGSAVAQWTINFLGI